MRLGSLYLAGWMPFAAECELVLPPGPIAIVGMHDGDARRSNRSGKTALLEAITWAFFGVHRKRLDDDVIHHGASSCEVRVALCGDIEMTVTRKRARGSSTKLRVDVAGAVLVGDAAQSKISEVIGLRLEDYLATLCFRQGEIESIVSLRAGQRLELVSEWLSLARWVVAKKIQGAKVQEVLTALAAKRASIATVLESILSVGNREAIEAELVALQERIRGLEALEDEREQVVEETHRARTALGVHRELAELRESAIALRTGLATRRVADAEAAETDRVLANALVEESRVDRLLRQTATIAESGFDGRCPVTCGPCPVAAEVEREVVESTTLHSGYVAERRSLAERAATARTAFVTARGAVTLLDRQAARYVELTQRGKALSEELKTMPSEAEAFAMVEAHAGESSVETRVEIAEASAAIGARRAALVASAAASSRYEEMLASLRLLEASARAQQLALRAISSVPAEIAREELLALETEANLLLSASGVSLRFSWARELGDKAPSCDSCGHVFGTQRGDACPKCSAARGKKLAQELEILADDGSGLEEDIRFNSGGTRAVVGASLRLAASALLRRLRSSQAAWAIVDEPFAALDTDNREALARAFAGMLGSVGLEQALVVSHDAALLAALPNRIVIDKSAGVSSVRLE